MSTEPGATGGSMQQTGATAVARQPGTTVAPSPDLHLPEWLRNEDPWAKGGTVDQFCGLVYARGNMKMAAQLLGLKWKTIEKMLQRGREEDADPVRARFALEVDRARAQWMQQRIGKMQDAGDAGDWRANAWLLERVAPEEFGKGDTDVDGNPLGRDVNITLSFGHGLRAEVEDIVDAEVVE